MTKNRKPKAVAGDIRWMKPCDMDEVLDIERLSFRAPWTENDFKLTLGKKSIIGMVNEDGSIITAFMVYGVFHDRIHLHNLAVHPDNRRRGIGKAMIDKLKGKLSQQRRRRIICEVSERNVDAQLFLRSQGFLAVEVLRSYYFCGMDAYLMEHIH